MHLGLVAPLPPTPSGVAEWVKFALPLLEQHAEITCFVPDVEAVDADIRAAHNVRHVSERGDKAIDMLVYHVGNNPFHGFVIDALREGPAGLVEVHDGSLHHYIQERTLGHDDDPLSYIEFGESAHGWAGKRLANMRWRRYRGSVELFLYDYLQIVLDRARGVIVHSSYAEQLVQIRCPKVHTWLVPLHAPQISPDSSAREWTGISKDTLLIAHPGFVTLPKRGELYLDALRQVIDRGVKAHFVFAGKPDPIMAQRLPQKIAELKLEDHVTITGYLETNDLERWIQAVDVIVNLRAPHVGESSGSLAYGLAAGKPVIVQPIGSWAELPEDVVVRLPVTEDDAGALAATLFALGQDASIRRRFGDRAKEYAQTELDAHVCVERLIQAAREAVVSDWTPPAWTVPGRTVAALTFLESGKTRIEEILQSDQVSGAAGREVLARVKPARPYAKLLAIDVPASLLQLLGTVWGYEVHATVTDESMGELSVPAQPGVSSTLIVQRKFDMENMTFDEYDVIVTQHIVGPAEEFLAACNRALTPQGLFALLQPNLSLNILDEGGFSPHVHDDHPGWTVPFDESPSHISVGTKASLPTGAIY